MRRSQERNTPGVAQLGDLPHRPHERALDQVRRLVGVAHVAQAEGEHGALVTPDQPIEGRAIAALRALDQHFVGRVVGLCHANQNEPGSCRSWSRHLDLGFRRAPEQTRAKDPSADATG